MAAAVLRRPDGNVRPPPPHVLAHLLVAAPRLRNVHVRHLPEHHVAQAVCALAIDFVQHKEILRLQVTIEVRILKVRLRKLVVVKGGEGDRLLGRSVRPEPDGLRLDACLHELVDFGIVVHAQDALRDSCAQVLRLRDAQALRQLLLAQPEVRLEARTHQLQDAHVLLARTPLDALTAPVDHLVFHRRHVRGLQGPRTRLRQNGREGLRTPLGGVCRLRARLEVDGVGAGDVLRMPRPHLVDDGLPVQLHLNEVDLRNLPEVYQHDLVVERVDVLLPEV